MPTAQTNELIVALLKQNAQLIDLVGDMAKKSSPVDVIRALNGPVVEAPRPRGPGLDPLDGDETLIPELARDDPWADENIQSVDLLDGRQNWPDAEDELDEEHPSSGVLDG